MNVNSELASNLQKLISLEPDLARELQGVEGVDQANERISAVAGSHGISLDSDGLANLLQALKTNATKGEMNEEQLAGVAGGLMFPREWVGNR